MVQIGRTDLRYELDRELCLHFKRNVSVSVHNCVSI